VLLAVKIMKINIEEDDDVTMTTIMAMILT